MHTLEFMVILMAAYVIVHLFGATSDVKVAALAVLIAAFAKFARVSPQVPIDDYVNKPGSTE